LELNDDKKKRGVLSSLVVHLGGNPSFGHYISFINTAKGLFKISQIYFQ